MSRKLKNSARDLLASLDTTQVERLKRDGLQLLRRLEIARFERFFRRFWKLVLWMTFLTLTAGQQAAYTVGLFVKPQLWLPLPFVGYFEGPYPAPFPLSGWLSWVLLTLLLAFMHRFWRGIWGGVRWTGWALFAATMLFTTWK